MASLVAAVALGFGSGPADGGKDVTEMRVSYRHLIVGTSEVADMRGCVEVWEFRRNGQFAVTISYPDGSVDNASGTYRVTSQELQLRYTPRPHITWNLVRLDRRVLLFRFDNTTVQLRRR